MRMVLSQFGIWLFGDSLCVFLMFEFLLVQFNIIHKLQIIRRESEHNL